MATSPRLLIVDDDEVMLRAVSSQLRRAGWPHWRIETSSTPVDPSGFDVALLDWVPYGETMAAWCRSWRIPFVVFTGGDTDNVLESLGGTLSGAVVVAKPYRIEDLRANLLNALATRPPVAEVLREG